MPRRPRGSGSVRKRPGRGWEFRWEGRTFGGYRSRVEAERVLVQKRAEALNRRAGVAADPRHTPTLGELAGPWLEIRKATHAAGAEDGYRWHKHLAPHFGKLRPDEVDDARIRAFVVAKLDELEPSTIRVCMAILSSLYEDLRERHLSRANPARQLPKSILRLMRSRHDPTTVPFVERTDDIRRVYLALPEPLNVAYALGAMAGLRPREIFALLWESVDLAAGRIFVRKKDAKDGDPRTVLISDSLLPVLEAWKLKTGGTGIVVPPLRRDGKKIDKATRNDAIREALRSIGLERVAAYRKPWYAASRHTFASQWVMAGGSIEKLSKTLGHASVRQTEVYAHLRPDLFTDADRNTVRVDLSPAGGAKIVVPTWSGPKRRAARSRKS